MQLPDELRASLETELNEIPARDLTAAVRDLSERYRTHHARAGSPFLRSRLDVAAYAAYSLPATYAAIDAVMEEVRERRPDLQPRSVLDVGAGLGTAAWAALEIWPEVEGITLLERDPCMIQLGKTLAESAHSSALRQATWRQVDVAASWESAPADLTVAAYLLGELPAEDQAGLVRRLWDHTADTCLIVEPGTPRGYALIRQAGDELARDGASILAPFPPDWRCLEHENDWCHFARRVPRTRLHRAAKDAALAYEDEKFSYIAASRRPGSPIAARVIRQPQHRSGHVRLVLCTAQGVRHVVVPRSRRDAYRRARDLRWGSAIPIEDAALYGLHS